MYQLFLFFMITDPRTVVKGKKNQLIVVALIALCEALIRSLATVSVPMPAAFIAAPALLSLAIVGPIAKFIDLRKNPPARPAI